MKTFPYNKFLSIAVIVVFLASCTEEIVVNLNSSDSQIVIEGNVSSDGEFSIIKISKSVDFNESNDFPKVEGALVTLGDNLGNLEILNETSSGVYSTSSLLGVIDRTYFLTVDTGGNTFTSTSVLPKQVDFGSLEIEESETGGGGPVGEEESSNYDVFVTYSDPEGEKNFYRFIEIVNDKKEGVYVFDDRLSDGLKVKQNLRRRGRDYKPNDSVQIIMQCIDENVYNYFSSFGTTEGNPLNTSTPANPNTNIKGAVLGYFSAHTVEAKQEKIN